MSLTAPIPKFAIGDTVYVANVERVTEQLPCPDCLGTQKWAVRSPAGGEYTTACPRCQRTYAFRNELPSLTVERFIGKAMARVITGMELHVGQTPEYRASIGGGSSWIIYEDKAWLTEAEAQAIANAQAAERNVEVEAKPEVLTKRHFSDLTLDEGRWDQFKNGLWKSQYHAASIVEKVQEALLGEDGETEVSTSDALEGLRDAVRWDFNYHAENLPLSPLVTAALASEDPEVRSAAEALPDAMKKLLTGSWKEQAA